MRPPPHHWQPPQDPLSKAYRDLRFAWQRFLTLSMRKDVLDRVPEPERPGFLQEIHEGQDAIGEQMRRLEAKIAELTAPNRQVTPSEEPCP